LFFLVFKTKNSNLNTKKELPRTCFEDCGSKKVFQKIKKVFQKTKKVFQKIKIRFQKTNFRFQNFRLLFLLNKKAKPKESKRNH
jgi:hypothetical protein